MFEREGDRCDHEHASSRVNDDKYPPSKKKKAVLKRGQEKSPSSVEWVKTSVRCDL